MNRCQPPLRYSIGLMPAYLRKKHVKWDDVLNPRAADMSDIFMEPPRSSSRARFIRASDTYSGSRPIIVLTGVLSLGGILNAGFDQIFNLYSFPVYEVADVIDTLAFRVGFQGGDHSFGAAVGLFNSTIAMTLIVTSYWMAKKFANYEIL